MNRKKRRQKTEPRPKKQIGWWVLWAFGMVVALVTMGLLLARLYPGIWATLSKERVAMLIGMGVALVAVIVLLAIGGASLGWTGFGDKTLWEWVQLLSSLAMPIVLAIAGFWFTTQQEKSGRKIEEQRAYDAALQAYVDQMSTLLIAKDLRSATEDNATEDTKEAQTVARARTVAVLGSLGPDLGQGPDRKRTIIKFLHEASLIDKDNPVIRLEEANLGGADLNYAILPDARLPFVFLNGANLERANLQDADLGGATLTDANLSNTNLNNANLTFANLSSANLDRVDLNSAVLNSAVLSGANLAGANLSGASLQGAIGVTAKTLEQQTENLGLTIMPDGSVHAGHYVTGEFIGDEGLGPTLSFNVGKGWERDPRVLPMNGELFLNGPEGGQLIFMTPLHVFDTSNLSKPQKVDAPEDADKWVTWFHKHPRLETSKPFRVRIGDASGRGIDVTAPPDLCPYGRPCIPLYYGPTQIAIWSGWKDRIVIVDVEGRRVVIDISAPADKFDEFLPEAQKVLDTVEW